MKEKECVPEIFAFRSFGTVIYGEEEEKMNLIQNNESVNIDCEPRPGFSAEPRGEGKRSAAEGWAWCTAGSGG